MKLISLKLLNYRRFRQEEIIFKENFSLIFGKNGAGKSSILDAIGYALFGPESDDFVRINKLYSKSFFAEEKVRSKIELIFSYGTEEYRIVRIISTGFKKFNNDFIPETKDSLIYGGNIILGGKEITIEISKIIGISRNTFLKSIFTKQKDLEILSGGGAERKKLINTILGLDRIENIIIELGKEENIKQKDLKYLKDKIANFDFNALNIKKEKINFELNKILEKLQKTLSEGTKLSKKCDNLKNDFNKINDKRNEFIQLHQNFLLKKQQNLDISKNIEDKKNSLLEIQKKEEFLKNNQQIIIKEQELKKSLFEQEEKKSKFEQKNELEKELSQNISLIKELEKKIKEINIEDIKQNIQNSNNKIEKINNDIKEFFLQKSNLESELKQIEKYGNEIKNELENIEKIGQDSLCPTCKRPLKEQYPILISLFKKDLLSKRNEYKEKSKILIDIKSKIELKEEELKKLKINLTFLEQKEKENLIINEKYENIKKDISIKKEKINFLKNINYSYELHEKLIKEYNEVNLKFQEYKKIEGQISQKENIINLISILEKEFLENEILLKNLESKITKLDFKIEDFNNIKKSYDEIHSKIKSKNDEIYEIKNNKLILENELEKIQRQENDFREDKNTVDNLILEINYICLKKQIMSDYITYLLNYLKQNIESLASDYFYTITDGKYLEISLDEDYNILIDGKNINLYSGGEIDLANLCLRISLGQNITSSKGNFINFLVFDEILASQDKSRQQNILINLKKLENKFSQIILISHLEEIKDLATNLIEIKIISKEESIIMEI